MANDLLPDPQFGTQDWLRTYLPEIARTQLDFPNPEVPPDLRAAPAPQGFWERVGAPQPGRTYGNILPVSYDANGVPSFDLRGGLTGMGMQALGGLDRILAGKVTPVVSDPATGRDITNPEIMNTAGQAAGLVANGSLLAPAAPAGAVRMLGGIGAKTADKEALALAQRLTDAGTPADIVWNSTGWERGADGKWRFEIPDTHAALTEHDYSMPAQPGRTADDVNYSIGTAPNLTVKDVIDHPALFEAYPGLANLPVRPETHPSALGSFDPDTGVLRLAQGNYDNVLSTGLHELQHAIQTKEGFAPGGNSGQFTTIEDALKLQDGYLHEDALKNIIRQKFPGINPYKPMIDYQYYIRAKQRLEQLEQQGVDPDSLPMQNAKTILRRLQPLADKIDKAGLTDDFDLMVQNRKFQQDLANEGKQKYHRLAGEVEARNVQARQFMAPEELESTAPSKTAKVPLNEQLVMAPNKNPLGLSEPGVDGGVPALGDLHTLTEPELQQLHGVLRQQDATAVERALGPYAAKYNQLQRAANNPYDTARADKASAELQQMEAGLTANQKRILFGIGETGPTTDDVRGLLEAHASTGFAGQSKDHVAQDIAYALLKSDAAGITRAMSGQGSIPEQSALIKLRHGYNALKKLGVASSDIMPLVSKALIKIGLEPDDAQFMLEKFIGGQNTNNPLVK